MSTDTETWDDAGFVHSSGYRTEVLRRLDERPATPSTIAEGTGIMIAHVSRSLDELRDRDLVTLLVPEDVHKGRIYGITDYGEDALDRLAEIDGGESA